MPNNGKMNVEISFQPKKADLNVIETDLSRIINLARQPGQEMNKNLQNASQTAQKLRDILNNSFNKDLGTINTRKFNQELTKSKLTANDLKKAFSEAGANGVMSFNKLSSIIVGTNVKLKESNKLLDSMAKTMTNTVKWGVSAAVFDTITRSIKEAYDYSLDLNKSLNDIRIVTGQSAEQMASFAKEANDAAKQLNANTLDYTNAALIYYQQGLSDEEAKRRAEITTKVVNVTGESGQQASENLTAIWNGYKVTAQEAEMYIDKVAKVAASSAADLDELATGMSKVASAANSAGVDVDQLNAMLATVISTTREAPETIGSSFRTIFARLGDLQLDGTDEYGVSLGKVSSQMEALGIEILDQQGQMRDMGDIIEDTAAKWNTWTQAQRQAAAIAMGGKMQYSRLIALFDNWSQYEGYLNDSKNALGELDKQQAIFAEGTEAKLNKLKATWQDLYDTLIDDKEVGAGIDLMTNLVQVVENFFGSFGGGIKSITAFGALFSNVFNQQISKALISATNNLDTYQQNIDIIKNKLEYINQNVITGTNSDKPQDIAWQAGFEKQLEIATEIQKVKNGISQEDYNNLMSLQNQAAELQTQATYIKEIANEKGKVLGLDVEDAQQLEDYALKLNEIDEKYYETTNNLNTQLKITSDLLKNEKGLSEEAEKRFRVLSEIQDSVDMVRDFSNNELLSEKQKQDLIEKSNFLEKESSNILGKEEVQEEEIIKLRNRIKQIVLEINDLEKIGKNNLDEKQNTLNTLTQAQDDYNKKLNEEKITEEQINTILEGASKRANITTNVTQLTTALSSAVLGWSSVSSLMQTLESDTISLQDKITQLAMTGVSSGTMLFSSFKKLNDIMGYASTSSEVFSAKQTLSNIALKYGTDLSNANSIAVFKNQLMTKALIMAKEKEIIARDRTLESLSKEEMAKVLSITANKEEAATIYEVATAQETLNAAWYANPLMWVIGLVVAATAAYSAYQKHIEQVLESEIKAQKQTVENANTKLEESKKIEETSKTYEELYQKYKETGEVSKEFLNTSKLLIDQLDIENGWLLLQQEKYDELAEAIENAKNKKEEFNGVEIAEAGENAAKATLRASVEKNNKTGLGKWFLTSESLNSYALDTWKIAKGGVTRWATPELQKLLSRELSPEFITGTGNVGLNKSQIKDQETVYKYIEQLLKIKEVMESEKEFLQGSNLDFYDAVTKFLEKNAEAVEIVEKQVETTKNEIKDQALKEIGFSDKDIDNLDTYEKKVEQLRQKIIETRNIDEALLTEEQKKELESEIETLIAGASDTAAEYLQREKALQELMQLDGWDSTSAKGKIEQLAADDLDAFFTVIRDKGNIITEQTIDGLIYLAKAKTEQAAAQLQLDTSKAVLEKLTSGKSLTGEDEEAIKEVERQFQDLAEVEKRWGRESQEYITLLEGHLQDLEDKIIEVKQVTEDNLIDQAIEIDINTNEDEFVDKLDDILDQDYEVVVSIKSDVDTDFDAAESQMDKVAEAAKMIGENFVVANEDLRELNQAFPDIVQGVIDLGDGTSQLNEQAVQGAIDTARTEVEATKQATIEKLEAAKSEVIAKENAAREIAQIATRLGSDEVDASYDASKDIETIQNNLNKLKTDANKESAENQLKNDSKISEGAQISAGEIANNFKGAFENIMQNASKTASNAIANFKAMVTASKGGDASAIGAVGLNSFGKKIAGGAKDLIGSLTEYSSKQMESFTKNQWQDLAAQATEQADAYARARQDIEGEIAELSSRGSSIDDILNNARSGRGGKSSSALNKGSGGGGKGGKGSGNEKDPEQMELLDKERDIYHDVDIILKQISTDLDKLQTQEKKLVGKDLIANLNKQLSLLDKQINTTRQKIGIAQGEATRLKNALGNYGVNFNADGSIANYTDAYQSQLNYVNGIIAQYNTMSAEEQEGFKETVEQAKKDFENFTKQINDYDKIITDTLPGLEKDIQSAIDKEIEIKISKFNMEIEIRLDMSEAERDWNEFRRKVIDDIKDTDILGNAKADLQDFFSYYKDEEKGIIQTNTEHVNDIIEQLEAIRKGGTSSIYGDNQAQALEDLQTYYKQLMSDLTDVDELVEKIKKSYLDMMDEAKDKFDEQIGTYETLADMINHDMKVIQLVYGEESYNQLGKYYEQQEKNYNKQIDFQRQQVDFWRQQMVTYAQNAEEAEKAKENWLDAIKEWEKSVEGAIENLQSKYLNAINEIFQNLNDKVTNGLGLDYVSEQWRLINKNADEYLDSVNATYNIQKLQQKYLDSIAENSSLSAQRALNESMEYEIGILKERDKLTQYDIDRAELKYQIALKQIALQEAQQNKSSMRLKRDSQGNYSYQFVADENAVASAQQEISDLYNQLYNLDVGQYKNNLDELYNVWAEFQEKMAEAAQINDPEQREQRELLLKQEYGELINGIVQQNEDIRNNLYESSFLELSDLYDVSVENFSNMVEEDKELLMEGLVPYWNSGIQEMANVFAGEDGFLGVCREAFEELQDTTKDYEEGLNELQNAADEDFSSIAKGIDENIDFTRGLLQENEELITSYDRELKAIQDVIKELDILTEKYMRAKEEAIAATQAAYGYWQRQQEENADAARKNGTGGQSNAGDTGNASVETITIGTADSGDTRSEQGDGNLDVGDVATYSGSYYYDSYGTSPAGSKYSGVTDGIVIDKINNNPYGIHIHSADGLYGDLGWIKRQQLTGFDTGGYTGDWSGEMGRLALLHQKELVLNKQDTKNILDVVTVARNITAAIGNSTLARLAEIGSNISNWQDMNNGTLEQNVHIEASFPNVKDSHEIEDALNNLVNIASMRANRKR